MSVSMRETFYETLHKKWSFPWRLSSVNVTKSAVSSHLLKNLLIWSHLLKKSLMEGTLFYAVKKLSFPSCWGMKIWRFNTRFVIMLSVSKLILLIFFSLSKQTLSYQLIKGSLPEILNCFGHRGNGWQKSKEALMLVGLISLLVFAVCGEIILEEY